MQAMRGQDQACTEQEADHGMSVLSNAEHKIVFPEQIWSSLEVLGESRCRNIIDHQWKCIRVSQVKNMRKEIADLLRTTKQENARIRVETVIRENLLLQAFEVLELFLELLAVRAQLVEKSKDMPPDMIEALSSLVYSAQRLQVASDGQNNLIPCV
jgi:hypothetical protein